MGTESESDKVLGVTPRPGPLRRFFQRRSASTGRRPFLRFRFLLALFAAGFLALSYGCEQTEPLREYFREPTPHEEYELGLSRSGLANTALGQDWIRSASRALSEAPVLDPPFREQGYFPPEEPLALGYVIELERGQLMRVELRMDASGSALTFMDLYREPPDTSRVPVPVASADSSGRSLEYEAPRSGRYILRVQPELLRGGRYELEVRVGPSLAFPVSGRSTSAIQSFFGAPREGGRRTHHGVDIFAPRYTPVVASTEGYVRVRTSRLGGNVVWLRDSARRRSLYYAHLQEQLVSDGERVEPGDTIGLVGNSGNARTTPTHLHFGIYRRGEGPLNPWFFLHDPGGEPAELAVNSDRIGGWSRTREDGIHFREGPGRRARAVTELERHTPLRVLAAQGSWLRVRLPDGRSGYVAGRLTEGTESALRTQVADAPTPVAASPSREAPVQETVAAGRDVEVLGRFGEFLYVRARQGRPGWIGPESSISQAGALP